MKYMYNKKRSCL